MPRPIPKQWQSILHGPVFVINMNKSTERWSQVTDRLKEAGFINIIREQGVDASHEGQLESNWKKHDSPPFDPWDKEFVEFKGKQGCFLSHANIWKKMIEEEIPYASIFEDDILFHSGWKEIAPLYYEHTPNDWDILYLGSQHDFTSTFNVDKGPVYCTHAMVVTLEGARKLYDCIVKNPKGVYTVDYMIKVEMCKKAPCISWYVWNGLLFPSPEAQMSRGWARRNGGLVFQDEKFGSYIKDHY